MTNFFEVLRTYPLPFVAIVLVPLFGGVVAGVVGAYVGFDNLSARLANERQQQRIEGRQEEIKQQLNGLTVPIEALRRYEQMLQSQGQGFDVLRRILSQYDELRHGIEVHERFRGTQASAERIAAADHILGELRSLLGTTQTVPGPGGQALIIKTGPNAFRVTFAVPMRIAPVLTFTDLPRGIEAHAIEKTNIGFTVVFTPSDVKVEHFGFQANAEL